MKINKILLGISLFAIVLSMNSCEDFLEVETPNYMLDSNTVFANDQTAQAALQGLFNQLFNTSFANGGSQSVSFLGGLSADTYTLASSTPDLVEFQQNQISPDNNSNLQVWSSAYNIIYQANSLLNGIEDNVLLSQEVLNQIEGSGKFIRAFTYFYLVNLYGDIPLILDTDYQQNSLASRTSTEKIYSQILNDLEDASSLLNEDYSGDERFRVNKFGALAMLARTHLFLGNWQKAEMYSSQVIEASTYYELLEDPNTIFLANSREAIWQISPIGWGYSFTHTRDGNLLAKTTTSYNPVVLSVDLLNAFTENDKRNENWISPFETSNDTLYYPYKYKIQYDASGGPIKEYSMVLRLAEQYLIRAEARTRLGDFSGAIEDLNKIKNRAGIALIDISQGSPSEDVILDEILLERRREFFSEWGYRWFDLRRFNKAEVLKNKLNSNWTPASNLFPIPSSERMKDPNLTQNPGY